MVCIERSRLTRLLRVATEAHAADTESEAYGIAYHDTNAYQNLVDRLEALTAADLEGV